MPANSGTDHRRYHQSSAALADADDLRWFRVVSFEEDAGIEPFFESWGVLPEHLIDHRVAVETQSCCRYPPLRFGPEKGVRRENDDITEIDAFA